MRKTKPDKAQAEADALDTLRSIAPKGTTIYALWQGSKKRGDGTMVRCYNFMVIHNNKPTILDLEIGLAGIADFKESTKLTPRYIETTGDYQHVVANMGSYVWLDNRAYPQPQYTIN